MTSTDSTAPAESVDLDGLRAQRDLLRRQIHELTQCHRGPSLDRLLGRLIAERDDLDDTILQAATDEQSASAS